MKIHDYTWDGADLKQCEGVMGTVHFDNERNIHYLELQRYDFVGEECLQQLIAEHTYLKAKCELYEKVLEKMPGFDAENALEEGAKL